MKIRDKLKAKIILFQSIRWAIPIKHMKIIFLGLSTVFLLAACGQIPISTPDHAGPTTKDHTNEVTEIPAAPSTPEPTATATAKAIMEKFDQPTPTEKPGEPTPTVQAPVVVETAQPTAKPTQTSLPTSMPPTPILKKPSTYTIHEGEHVYCLARRFDVNPIDIMDLNGLNNYSYLSAGDV